MSRAVHFSAVCALVFALFFIVQSCYAQIFDSASITAFDQTVDEAMTQSGVPGLAIALIERGQVIWTKGYGLADKEAGISVTPSTLFQAASVSKSLSAWAVMRLVEQGKLALDTPVSHYLTRWKLPDTGYGSNAVTLRRILSHTAGLSVPGYLGFGPGQALQSIEASLASADDTGHQGVRVIYHPGASFHYSGGGYTVIQLIIEEATHSDFAQWVQRNVLEPLEMQHSSFVPPAAHAASYDAYGARVPDRRFTALAAAGLYSSAADLGKFVAALLNGPHGEAIGRGVLATQTVRDVLMPQPSSESSEILVLSEWGLGYGLKFLPESKHTLVYHPGDNIPGFHNFIAAIPSARAGLVVLTNGAQGRQLRMTVLCTWLRMHNEGTLQECRGR